MTFAWSSLRTLNRMARLSLSFFSRNRPLSRSSGDGGALRSSETDPSSGTLWHTHNDLTAMSGLQSCDTLLSMFTDTSLSWLLCVQRQHESAGWGHAQICPHACLWVCRCVCNGACVLSHAATACKISRAYYIRAVKGSRVHCVHSEATCQPNTRIFASAQSGASAYWVAMSDTISPTGHLSQQTHTLTSSSWSWGVSAGSLSQNFFSFGKKHRVWSRSLGSQNRVRCCCSR